MEATNAKTTMVNTYKLYFAFSLVAGLFYICSTAHGQAVEAVMKAVAIEKISQFVTWPDEKDAKALSDRFVIDLVGDVADVAHVKELYNDHRIKNRKVRIRHVPLSEDVSLDDISGCHVLYMVGEKKEHALDILNMTVDKPILTIGDSPEFIDKGGLVYLYIKDNKLRFALNEAGFRKAGLIIDSLLLKVAKIINPVERKK